MAKIDKEAVKKLTKLSRIRCSEEEEAKLLEDLKSILTYVEQLDAINTDGVAPCNHVLPDVCNVMRDDVVGKVMPREKFLENVSDRAGGFVKVPSVIKSNSSTSE